MKWIPSPQKLAAANSASAREEADFPNGPSAGPKEGTYFSGEQRRYGVRAETGVQGEGQLAMKPT